MGNVTLPAPVAVAAGALCILGGYVVGVVAGPTPPSRTTAEVASWDRGTSELCLTGEAVADLAAVDEDGQLCGTWRRIPGAQEPGAGDSFRFVTIANDEPGDEDAKVYIYGDVLP